MTDAVWRIAVEAPAYFANDISGSGALDTTGRWNSKGTRIVYCSSSISLAVLETLVGKRSEPMAYNRYLIRVAIPPTVWAARERFAPPAGWDAIPAGRTSLGVGDTWVASMRSPILLVPSVIVPEESNVLINPSHPAAASIIATTVRRWNYDPRLF